MIEESRLTCLRRWFVVAGDETTTSRLRWRRVALALLMFAAAGYGALVGTAYGVVRHHRGLTELRFADVALPWRWSRYRVARGDELVRLAEQLFAQEKYREALMYLKTGVAHSPANRDGRLLLARLLVASGQGTLARRTLFDGLPYHAGDAAYWRPLLGTLLQEQADAVVIALARRYLPRTPRSAASARTLALAAATASYFRQDYAACAEFLRRCPALAGSRDGRLLLAKADYDAGYRELALVQLRALAGEDSGDYDVLRELAFCWRESGRPEEGRRALLACALARPAQNPARVDLLRLYYEQRDQDAIARSLTEFARDGPREPGLLIAAAGAAADAGDLPGVRRLLAAAPPEHAMTGEFLAIEAMLTARDYEAALAAARTLATDAANAGPGSPALIASLRAIAYLGIGDAADARAFVATLLAQPRLRPDNLLAVANRLAALDGGELARQALKRAVEIDPLYQPALARLVELDLLLNRVDDLAVDARRLTELRRPPVELLRVVRHKLSTDLFLYSPENEGALAAIERVVARARRR